MRTLSELTFALAIVVLVAGCDPEPTHYWYNPMRSLEQARKDCKECQARVEKVKAETAAAREAQRQKEGKPESKEGKRRYDDRVDTLATWDDMYLENVFSGCMGGKGYFKVEAERLPPNVKRETLEGNPIAGRK